MTRFRPTLWLVATLAASLFSACDDSAAPAPETGRAPVPDAAPLAPPTPGPDGKVRLTDAEWRARLTPAQFYVLREAGTERAGSGAYWRMEGKKGVYHCAACDLALFDSTTKFDSGTGWPSFTGPISADRVIDKTDTTHGMIRTENVCARCESHLGQSFPDGPPPTGLRYCMNSLALRFAPADAPISPTK